MKDSEVFDKINEARLKQSQGIKAVVEKVAEVLANSIILHKEKINTKNQSK